MFYEEAQYVYLFHLKYILFDYYPDQLLSGEFVLYIYICINLSLNMKYNDNI